MKRRTVLLAAAAIAGLYGAAQAALSTGAVRARLRERIDAALAPRLGHVDVGDVRVDPLFRVSFGPVALPLGRGGAVVASVERVRVRPSAWALLRGRAEPAKVELRGVTLPSRPDLGPLDADLYPSREADRDRLAGRLWLPGGGRLDLDVARGATGIAARVRGSRLGPADLPEALRAASGGVVEGAFAFELDAEAAPDLSRADATFRATAAGVVIAGARVGPEPAGPLSTEARGRLAWDGRARRVSLREASVDAPGGIPVAVSGELGLGGARPFALAIRAERVSYAALVAGLPPSLAPPPSAPRPEGTFDARLDLSGPLADPAAWTVDAALDLSALRAAARRGAPSPLLSTFVHRPPNDPRREIVVGPENPDFVPLSELPEHVVRAITTSEDAGFFGHAGFDFGELRNALAEGAEAGRVVRGGSTITQQLAKNLYLSQERTLARKVREAVIAVGLEAAAPKRRLLEIYVNVAEWGPGIWGIGPAARHWFRKDARALTAKEAAFLASIIPSPIRYHAMFDRGYPTERWERHVDDLLYKMSAQGVLSTDELLEGIEAPLFFAGG